MPPEAQEGGAARTGGGCPTHSEDGERLIGSVCRQDKDSSRAGAGSLECLPDNAQNLAEDEQLPGRIAWKSEEPGLLILPPSLLPQSQRELLQADNRKNVYLCVCETGLHSLLTPRVPGIPRSPLPLLTHPCPSLNGFLSRSTSGDFGC